MLRFPQINPKKCDGNISVFISLIPSIFDLSIINFISESVIILNINKFNFIFIIKKMLSTGILQIPTQSIPKSKKKITNRYDYKYIEKVVDFGDPLIFNDGRMIEFTIFSSTYVKPGSIKLICDVINPNFNNYLQLDGNPSNIIKRMTFLYRSKVLEEITDFDILQNFENDLYNLDNEDLNQNQLKIGTLNTLIPAASNMSHYLFNPQQIHTKFDKVTDINNGRLSYIKSNRKRFEINLSGFIFSTTTLIPMYIFPLGLKIQIELNEHAFFVPVFNASLQDLVSASLNNSEYTIYRYLIKEINEARKIKKIIENNPVKIQSDQFILDKKDWKAINICGSGNCLYEVASYYFYKTASEAESLKEKIHKLLKENAYKYITHIDKTVYASLRSDTSEKMMIEYLSKDEAIRGAGDAEILAISDFFKTPIEVYRASDYSLQYTTNTGYDKKPIKLLHNVNHYHALIPKYDSLIVSTVVYSIDQLIDIQYLKTSFQLTRNKLRHLPDSINIINWDVLKKIENTMGPNEIFKLNNSTKLSTNETLFFDNDTLLKALIEGNNELLESQINWNWFSIAPSTKISDLSMVRSKDDPHTILFHEYLFDLPKIRATQRSKPLLYPDISSVLVTDPLAYFKPDFIEKLKNDWDFDSILPIYMAYIDAFVLTVANNKWGNLRNAFKAGNQTLINQLLSEKHMVKYASDDVLLSKLKIDLLGKSLLNQSYLSSISNLNVQLDQVTFLSIISEKMKLFKDDLFKRLVDNYGYKQAYNILKNKFTNLFNYRFQEKIILDLLQKKEFGRLKSIINNKWLSQFRTIKDIEEYNPFDVKKSIENKLIDPDDKRLLTQLIKTGNIYSNFGGIKIDSKPNIEIAGILSQLTFFVEEHKSSFIVDDFEYYPLFEEGLLFEFMGTLLIHTEDVSLFQVGRFGKADMGDYAEKATGYLGTASVLLGSLGNLVNIGVSWGVSSVVGSIVEWGYEKLYGKSKTVSSVVNISKVVGFWHLLKNVDAVQGLARAASAAKYAGEAIMLFIKGLSYLSVPYNLLVNASAWLTAHVGVYVGMLPYFVIPAVIFCAAYIAYRISKWGYNKVVGSEKARSIFQYTPGGLQSFIFNGLKTDFTTLGLDKTVILGSLSPQLMGVIASTLQSQGVNNELLIKLLQDRIDEQLKNATSGISASGDASREELKQTLKENGMYDFAQNLFMGESMFSNVQDNATIDPSKFTGGASDKKININDPQLKDKVKAAAKSLTDFDEEMEKQKIYKKYPNASDADIEAYFTALGIRRTGKPVFT